MTSGPLEQGVSTFVPSCVRIPSSDAKPEMWFFWIAQSRQTAICDGPHALDSDDLVSPKMTWGRLQCWPTGSLHAGYLLRWGRLASAWSPYYTREEWASMIQDAKRQNTAYRKLGSVAVFPRGKCLLPNFSMTIIVRTRDMCGWSVSVTLGLNMPVGTFQIGNAIPGRTTVSKHP